MCAHVHLKSLTELAAQNSKSTLANRLLLHANHFPTMSVSEVLQGANPVSVEQAMPTQ